MIPAKLNNGDPFKYNVARTINDIIDCLKELQITSVVGGTFARTKGGTTITIPYRAGGGGASGGSSVGSAYRGSFAIVRNADGTYQICDNSGSVPDDNRIRINSVDYTVPITAIAANDVTVYLRIDLTGDVPGLTLSTSGATAENVLVYAIGTVSATGTIWQDWTAGELDLQTPVIIDPSLSAFLAVTATNRIKFNDLPGAPYTGLWVPVMNNGVAIMAPCASLDDAAYQESSE